MVFGRFRIDFDKRRFYGIILHNPESVTSIGDHVSDNCPKLTIPHPKDHTPNHGLKRTESKLKHFNKGNYP